MPGTRKLGRTTDHRRAMLRGMVTLLLEKGKIETTLSRAKEIAPLAEKMITLGKKNTLAARRMAMSFITKEDVVKKLFDEIAPKYENRAGGYTQIFKTGFRRGDGAETAIIRLFEEPVKEEKKSAAKKPARKKAAKAETTAATPAAEETPKTEEVPKADETTAEAAPAEEAKTE